MADFGSAAKPQHPVGGRSDGFPPASDNEGSRPRGFPPAMSWSGFALRRAAGTRGGSGVTPRPFEMSAFAFSRAVLDAGSGQGAAVVRGCPARHETGGELADGRWPDADFGCPDRRQDPVCRWRPGAVRAGSHPQASAVGPRCRRSEPPAVSHRVMEVGAVVAVSSSREQAAPGGAVGRDGGDGGRVRQWEAGPGGAEWAQRRGNGESREPGGIRRRAP
jgi:hypothetical protein